MATSVIFTFYDVSTKPSNFDEVDSGGKYDAINSFLDSDPGRWLHLCIYYVLDLIVMVTAICTNSINVFVFLSGGLSDGITVIFLGISISDLLFCVFMSLSHSITAVHGVFDYHPYLKTSHLSFIMIKWAGIWFMLSPLLTVFAAVQKCACVASPLTFRNFFTLRRSSFVVVGLYILAVGYNMPYLSMDLLAPYHDEVFNRTRLGLAFRSLTFMTTMYGIVGIISRIFVPFVSQAIVIACVFIMTFKLRAAANVRLKMRAPRLTPSRDAPGGRHEDEESKTQNKGEMTTKKEKNSTSELSGKELRAIHAVNIVCILFITGMTPSTILQAVESAVPDFGDVGPLASLFLFLYGIRQFIIVGSMVLNIFVYYHYNTKYKSIFDKNFKASVCCKKGEAAAIKS